MQDYIADYIAALQILVLENAVLIVAVGLGLWLISEIAMRFVRHHDKRISYLASFLDVDAKQIIPLPPGNALFHDYARLHRDANAQTQIPPGAPSLQGTYLVHAGGGMTVIAIHNFNVVELYQDPEEPELTDYITPSLAQSGRLVAHRLPVDIEQDLALRVQFVEFLLQAKFGYPGKVRGALLLRDDDSIAPGPEGTFVENGTQIQHLSFEDKASAKSSLICTDSPVAAENFGKISTWFTSYAGRQTPKLKMLLRCALLALCLAILATGNTTVKPDILQDLTALFEM